MNCTNSTSLDLNTNTQITDIGISHLVNLRSLDLDYNDSITDTGLKNLTNLTELIFGNTIILFRKMG